MKLWITVRHDRNALEKDLMLLVRATVTNCKEIRIILINILNKCVAHPHSEYCREAKLGLICYSSNFEHVKTGLEDITNIGFEELAFIVPLATEILSKRTADVPRFRAQL